MIPLAFMLGIAFIVTTVMINYRRHVRRNDEEARKRDRNR
jgi:hypothetical protein